VVSHNNTEADYWSVATVLTEITWISSLLQELHIVSDVPTIHSDNLGTVLLVANPVLHSHSKHFELDIHCKRSCTTTSCSSYSFSWMLSSC